MASSFGTDHVRSKHAAAPIALADLTTSSGVNLLKQWLDNEYVVGIFLAPPCGTSSRARNIPLKRKSPGDPPAPKPLRSDQHPNGLPFLKFLDRVKVSKANKLYFLTAELVLWANEVGCIVCIENPQFSFFWQTTFIQSILHLLKFTIFQSCRYGSSRPKRTMLGFNVEEFSVINKMCCGVGPSHRHAKWGLDHTSNKFATALETAYPMPLARIIAAQFVLALHRLGFKAMPETMAEVTNLDAAVLPALGASGGVQSKASKLPPMIPTYSAKIQLTGLVSKLPAINLLAKLPKPLHVSTLTAPTELPKGSKLLALSPPVLPPTVVQRGVYVSKQHLTDDEVKLITEKFAGGDVDRFSGEGQSQLWGIPWSEDEFARQMVCHGHPTALQSCLPSVLQETINFYSKTTAHERILHRANRLGHWVKRLHALREQEAELKAGMHPDVADILRNKNVLLWKEMLQHNGYGDMGVVDEFCSGTELTGQIPDTGLWPKKFSPACMVESDLADVASNKERPGLRQLYENQAGGEFVKEVWEKTMEEQGAGLLVGPFELEDIPSECPLSRRFGIQQGAKVRCIDDFSMSSVNACVQSVESPKPHTLDVFSAMCAEAMSVVKKPHSWKGRTFDLTGAYRQCAVHPSSAKHAYIMVVNPDTGCLGAFRMRALPFGAIRSVHAFLRMSHSLWFLLVKEFHVLTTNYFDDFVTLAVDEEAAALKSCVHLFFKLLGWLFAEAGPKAPDFASEFQALGVLIDVGNMSAGVVRLGNTESRRQELLILLKEVLSSGQLTKVNALRLRGRLQFAAANIFGRVPRAALSAVTSPAYSSRSAKVNDDMKLALRLYVRILTSGKPRELKPASNKCWFIQTDASYEPTATGALSGLGAVLFNPEGVPVSFFSAEVCEAVLNAFNPKGVKKTLIFECEFLALFAAFWKWSEEIDDSLVIYTDNNAVRDVMIACSTNNDTAKVLLVAALVVEGRRCLLPWYSRVPTDSNTADGPSRFDLEKLLALGAKQVELDVLQCWEVAKAFYLTWGEEQASFNSPLEKDAPE